MSKALVSTEAQEARDAAFAKVDLMASRQEMIRRGIETILAVSRDSGSVAITAEIRAAASNKLHEFVKALEVPTKEEQ